MKELETLINYISSVGLSTLILIVFGIIALIVQSIKSIDFIINYFGVETKLSKSRKQNSSMIASHEAKFSNIDTKLEKVELQLENLRIANREALGDRINQKYKLYLKKGYIPEDEYEEFVSLHDAYNGVGGNHTGDAKFKKCLNDLPIKVDDDLPITISRNK